MCDWLLSVALLAATLAAAGAESAYACSCADLDPRDRIEEGAAAMIGRVVEATHGDPSAPAGESRYVVRVERALNVRLGDRIVIKASRNGASCGFEWREGQRVGAFLHRQPGGGWTISVCPGGRMAAELVERGRRRTSVAVRSLESLRVVSAAEVPRLTAELSCADAAGATVYAGGIEYGGRPARGRAVVHRVTGRTRRRLVNRPAEQLGLGPDAAYVWSRGRLLAIALADGSERTLLRMGLPERTVPSPFGGQLAVQGLDGRDAVFGTDRYGLVRLDLESGRKRIAARLPDRGIADLVGVPDGPELDVPRRAPRALAPAAGAAWTRLTCAG